jgi:hypothetical protein
VVPAPEGLARRLALALALAVLELILDLVDFAIVFSN